VKSCIILLNGVGSVGKSSIARALQEIAQDPFLHVQMDAFLDMLPAAYQDHPAAFAYRTAEEGGNPVVDIMTGPVGERLMRGMRHAIAALANQGNKLIVDEVMTAESAEEYRRLLAAHDLFIVGVYAPLEALEVRERSRGDRLIGLARRQYQRLHKGMHYDLEIETSHATPLECAQRIKQEFGL